MFFSAAALRISKFRIRAAIVAVPTLVGSLFVKSMSIPRRSCVQTESDPRPDELMICQGFTCVWTS